jgi:type I restriction enzyme R subunit
LLTANQNPEQQARDNIDALLTHSGSLIQSFKQKNITAAVGVAISEYSTDTGPADYILFVNRKPIGVIEAKREEECVRLTMHEDQAEGYANGKLRLLNNEPLPFVYESTGELTRLTDYLPALKTKGTITLNEEKKWVLV